MNSIFAPNKSGWDIIHSSPNLKKRSTGAIVTGLDRLEVVVDWERGEICHRGGRRCKLSAREMALLACLARKAGTPVSRGEILSQVWKLDPGRTITRTIDMHISLLRRKLDDAEGVKFLITVHGVGYMLHHAAILCDHEHPSTGKVLRGRSGSWKITAGIETVSAL